MMHRLDPTTRREFLRRSMGGFGLLALQALAHAEAKHSSAATHHPAQAKSIIFLFMEGGPSQVDTFDYKPTLEKLAGKPLPFGTPATVFNSSDRIMPSPFAFHQFGESGAWVSDLLPHLSTCVDDMTFVHSLHHKTSNHSAACYMCHTGDPIAGRPSIGSWMSYGLGSENNDLPAFVVLDCGQAPSGGAHTYSSGFLPAVHSGVKFMNSKAPVEFLERQESTPRRQNAKFDTILKLGRRRQRQSPDDEHLESLIASYEKAARMQAAAPEVMQIDAESSATRRLYGVDDPATETFGSRCLLARRLVERGVRFVEVFSPRVKADRWDQHSNLKQGHLNNCRAVDKPIAGLLKDLKSRGLLENTIVLWGGEFGRTPSSQGGTGRDHNPFGYTMFMAGGGFRPGFHYGATDEFGYYAQHDKVHLHDLHATILHQMGLDHKRLTFRYRGRDFRLTDVHGRVVAPLIS